MAREVSERGRHSEETGVVVGNRMNKTIRVQVSRILKHKKYGKYVRRSEVFVAHDEKGEAKPGDSVRIREGRPLSKTKRWKLVEILSRGTAQEAEL